MTGALDTRSRRRANRGSSRRNRAKACAVGECEFLHRHVPGGAEYDEAHGRRSVEERAVHRGLVPGRPRVHQQHRHAVAPRGSHSPRKTPQLQRRGSPDGTASPRRLSFRRARARQYRSPTGSPRAHLSVGSGSQYCPHHEDASWSCRPPLIPTTARSCAAATSTARRAAVTPSNSTRCSCGRRSPPSRAFCTPTQRSLCPPRPAAARRGRRGGSLVHRFADRLT
jgi:hypothetical protein